jgi:hypothetical protein
LTKKITKLTEEEFDEIGARLEGLYQRSIIHLAYETGFLKRQDELT